MPKVSKTVPIDVPPHMQDAITTIAEIEGVDPQVILNKVANECVRRACAEMAVTVTITIPPESKPKLRMIAEKFGLNAKDVAAYAFESMVAMMANDIKRDGHDNEHQFAIECLQHSLAAAKGGAK